MIYFANIYCQCEACLFFLMSVSFAEQKFLTLIRSNLAFVFLLEIIHLVLYLNVSPNCRSHRFKSMFSS